MRNKSTGRSCDPQPFVRRNVPVEAHPMQMSLRQRRLVPIEITAKMRKRHIHPAHLRPGI